MRRHRREAHAVTGTAAEAWYTRQPERVGWELDEFARRGLPATVKYGANDYLVVLTELEFRGEPLPLAVHFSHGHPFLAPIVTAGRVVIDRHQHPIGCNFCLLEDANEDWQPQFSAAQLIENLKTLLDDTEKGRAAVYAAEADMPEPTSGFYPYVDDAVYLVGELFLERDLAATNGTISIIKGAGRVRVLENATGIGKLDEGLATGIAGGVTTVSGRWVALDVPPPPEGLDAGVLRALGEADGQPLASLAARFRKKKALPYAALLVGVTFIEQGPTRDEERRAWLFGEVTQQRGEPPQLKRLFRAQALSATERARRIPELAGLADAHIVIVGAGSLGAPVALELAKAGVGRLDIFDPDYYDINNAVRHVLPTRQAGEPKAEAVAGLCRALNPFIDVRSHGHSVGASVEGNLALDEVLQTATLVIDTTGEHAVGRFVESRVTTTETPLIVAGLTAGSFGADVFVVAPGGACFDCFKQAQLDGVVRLPRTGERSSVTPIGCSHPAFSGAGFEATELAAVVARRAVQQTGATSYPDSNVNWIVLNFRGEPRYDDGAIEPLASCWREHG